MELQQSRWDNMDLWNQIQIWIAEYMRTDKGDWNFIAKIMITILIILVVNIVVKLVTRAANKLIDRDPHIINYQKHKTLTNIIGKAVKVFFYFIALVQILDLFGVPTSSIIATAGVGGIAIGFGAKSVVEDIISGMFILFEDQYRLGDTVVIDGFEGTILEFGLRTTVVRGYDGSHYIITNGDIHSLVNRSKENQRANVTIQIPYNTDMKVVKELIQEVSDRLVEEFDYITKAPYLVGVTASNMQTKTLTIWGWAKPGKQASLELEIRGGVIAALEKKGIPFTGVLVEEEMK